MNRRRRDNDSLLKKLLSLPAITFRKWGMWQIVPFLVITCGALFIVTRGNFTSDFSQPLPDNDPYAVEKEKFSSGFASSDFVTIILQDEDLFSPDTLKRVASLTSSCEAMDKVSSVLSVTNIEDAGIIDNELVIDRLYSPVESDRGSIDELRKKISSTPLFKKYLQSKDGRAWHIFVFLEAAENYDDLVSGILDVLEKDDGKSSIIGDIVTKYFVDKTAKEEIFLLGGLALIIVLVFQIFITRSFKAGLLLTVSAALPVLWCFALFPLFQFEIAIYHIILPVIIIVLSTSYGIHLVRYYYSMPDRDMEDTLSTISPVILSAGFTTLIGFLSLLISRLQGLRQLGLFILFGILFSLIFALFFLPPLLRSVTGNLPNTGRALRQKGEIRLTYVKSRNVIFFALFLLVCIPGIFLIQHEYRGSHFFMPRSGTYRSVKTFFDANGASEELEIVIDLKEDYALFDPDNFEALDQLAHQIETLSDVSRCLGPTEIISWFNGRLLGAPGPVLPRDQYALGEAFELLSYQDSQLGLSSLVGKDYSTAKLVVQFGALDKSRNEARKSLESLIQSMEKLVGEMVPDADFAILGAPVQSGRYFVHIFQSQVKAIAFFFVFLSLFLFLILKSFKWSLITLIPVISSLIFYFGIIGWFRIPMNVLVVFIIAAVMGVSTDDILYFVLVFRSHYRGNNGDEALKLTVGRTGIAILQTTLIIMAGLTVMLFSRVRMLVTAGFLAGISLGVSTAVTLLVIPVILRYIYRKEERSAP